MSMIQEQGPARETLRAIFFDLDNTLLDHTSAAREAMRHVHGHYGDLFQGLPFDRVFEEWVAINDRFWSDYSAGLLSPAQLKVERLRALTAWSRNQCGLDEHCHETLVEEMSERYLGRVVSGSAAYDGVVRMLEGLRGRYILGVISNGFTDVQLGRLRSTGLDTYFDHIILSEDVGLSKPDPRIFHLALEAAGAAASETLYIGDNFLYDIGGASRAGLGTIWFNRSGAAAPSVIPEIHPGAVAGSIPELARLLGVPF